MARYYHLATFLNRVPNALLPVYFQFRKIENDLVWKNRKEQDTDDIYSFLENLDRDKKAIIKKDFEKIHDLACPSAMKAVYQACNMLNQKKVIAELDQMKNSYERAMWLFLKHDALFDLATKLDKVRTGSWKYCVAKTDGELKYDGKHVTNFKNSIKDFFQLQGDGRFCRVLSYEYEGKHYFFAYPEGKAETIPQYGNSETDIQDLTIKRMREVIFVYNKQTGILRTNAPGTTPEIASLQEKFCVHILALDGLPRQDNVMFHLEELKGNAGNFPLDDDEINVEGVRLKEIRFVNDITTKNRLKITLDDKGKKHQTYSDLLSSVGMGNNQKLKNAEIGFAKIQFYMRKPPKGKRPHLTFEITSSTDSSLEDGDTDMIARKYLEKWGIMEQLEFGEDNLELAEAAEQVEVTNEQTV